MIKNPKTIIHSPKSLPINGIKYAACCSGTKYKNRDDLLLITADAGSNISGCFTKSSMPSAPIIWTLKNIKKYQNTKQKIILLINAGNANAFTGDEGLIACEEKANAISSLMHCEKKNIFFASTGVIGEQLPYKKIIENFEFMKNELSNLDFERASHAILTTDLKPKTYTRKFKICKKEFSISAIAKGSGMIFPNMATMLAFIFTDFAIDKKSLSALTKKAVDCSFNRISIDGDTSTSDAVFTITTNKKNHNTKDMSKEDAFSIFFKELKNAMVDLSKQIVMDGEGARKFISISIKNAKSILQAKKISFSIANSLLVKTAIAGEDANWGRIIMAIGKTGIKLQTKKIKIYMQNILLCKNGRGLERVNEDSLTRALKKKNINIMVDLAEGDKEFTSWTSDLTEDYIKINADYRS